MTKNKKRIYLAGKVTGLKYTELTFKFGTAEKNLTGLGYEVVNPLNIVLDKSARWQQAMKLCIAALMNCDAIYMLHDWQQSEGAVMEHSIAKRLGIQIVYTGEKITL